METERDAIAASAMMRTVVPGQEAASQKAKFLKSSNVSLNISVFYEQVSYFGFMEIVYVKTL